MGGSRCTPASSRPRSWSRWWEPVVACLAWGALLGCGSNTSDRPPSPAPHAEEALDTLPAGVTLRTLEHQGARYTVASLDLRRVDLDLYGQTPEHGAVQTIPGLAAFLQGQGRRLVLATNAGIYETDGRPLGLHVERGRELAPRNLDEGTGNFFLVPNAVFYVSGEAGHEAARVIESASYAAPVDTVRLATQSGPALLLNGALHPRFLPDSDSLKLRSGVGVAASAPHVVHLAISEGEVRFYDFATLFRDRLSCSDALYLDGTVSVLSAPGRRGEAHTRGTFGGILVVSEPRVDRRVGAGH